MTPSDHPIIVLVPGASQTPSHYAYLLHLLQKQGYATMTAPLPSTGTTEKITVEDDRDFVRDRMLLPELEMENHNVIVITHSYSTLPGTAAVKGLGKSERAARGKKTAVLGQIVIAGFVTMGGDDKDVIALAGGQWPPHVQPDQAANTIRCADPIPPLFNDVDPEIARVAVTACMNPCYTSWTSPCPAASWAETDFKGRIAYIRTKLDQSLPYDIQNVMLQGTGQDWILKDIESGHSAQLSQPEKLAGVIIELVKQFESM